MDIIDDGIDSDFIGADKPIIYAPRAHNLTKNTTQSTIDQKLKLNTRRYCDKRYDKSMLTNKIVAKSLMHRIGGKRKSNAGVFVTFKE